MTHATAATLSRRLRKHRICNPQAPDMFGRKRGVFISNRADQRARIRVDLASPAENTQMINAIRDAVTAWGYTVESESDGGLTVRRP